MRLYQICDEKGEPLEEPLEIPAFKVVPRMLAFASEKGLDVVMLRMSIVDDRKPKPKAKKAPAKKAPAKKASSK